MDLTLLAGLAVAASAWGLLFALDRDGFWPRAAAAGAVIGAYGLVAQRHRLDRLLGVSAAEVAIGVVAAFVLYLVFYAGDRLLRWAMPRLAAEVGDLYALRAETAPRAIPLVLLVIGPGEELFWRGLVQARAGFVLAVVGYTLVHVWERKPVLLVAAAVGGVFWGGLFAWRDTLVAPLVSHALWDLLIIVWLPVRGRPSRASGVT
jgi:membrane protease YdiL (CAAX protease family)